jgi:endogenous inhibitor of DNA gyrase (YacG/DUF329 family)
MRWNKEDVELFRTNYPFMSNKELVEKYFPNRTEDQLFDKAKKLKIKKDKNYLEYRNWSKEEINYLIQNYASVDNNELEKHFNRKINEIIRKANSLGIKKNNWWSDEEFQILKDNYPFMSNKDLYKRFFSYRNFKSVVSMSSKLELRKDNDYLYKQQCEIGIKNLELIGDNKGENSPRWVEKVNYKCEICGKPLSMTQKRFGVYEHHFCSTECRVQFLSEYLKGENNPYTGDRSQLWDEDMKKAAAERAINRLCEGDFKLKKTQPEMTIRDSLTEMNVKYTEEYNCKYYLVDYYLSDCNLMIEVQGNFYHCNPVMNLENSRQSKIIHKDKSKHTYIKKYKNIEILYLWEKDIKENLELCNKLIQYYIEQNGVLENYHSFNYMLNDDGELELIKELYVIGY